MSVRALKSITTIAFGSFLALALVAASENTINGKKINEKRDEKVGRSEYLQAPADYGPAKILQWAQAHAARNPGFKYVFVPPALALDRISANILRVAAGKAWNHLSWQPQIDVPQDVSEGHGLVFALNAAGIWGAQAETNWGYLANCTPKANISISPAPQGDCAPFSPTEPVEIQRFVFNAVHGGPYANIHQTPPDYFSFQSKFNLGPLIATSSHREAIVCGPRITGYRTVNYNGMQLLYAFSSDEFYGRDNEDIRYTSAPTEADQRSTGAFNAAPGDGETAIASEWWMQLPNGFMYYGIHGEGSQERGKAEFPFAIDPANWKQGHDLTVARSCTTCHVGGIQSAPSDRAGQNGWTSKEQLDQLYAASYQKFQNAMRTIVEGISDMKGDLNDQLIAGTIEPISKAIMLVEGPYPGGYDCSFFCNGKFAAGRRNMCETLPAR